MPGLKTPRSKRQDTKGFTLIELLVVIAIIAILATIGLVIYSNTQKNGRDAKRKGDMNAIGNALETHYMTAAGTCPGQSTASNGGTYCPLVGNWFTTGNNSVPTDPTGGGITVYCYASNTTGATISDPAPWTNACNTAAGWNPVAAGAPPINTSSWKICASLETTGGVYCVGNQQQ